jgi:hypothetical protein
MTTWPHLHKYPFLLYSYRHQLLPLLTCYPVSTFNRRQLLFLSLATKTYLLIMPTDMWVQHFPD